MSLTMQKYDFQNGSDATELLSTSEIKNTVVFLSESAVWMN